GERAMANWDEDSVTMAVEAARDCLAGADRTRIASVFLASTTMPFEDRQNAGIAAAALNLPEEVATLDIAGSQRAGTSGLLAALAAAERADAGEVLFLTADKRATKAGAL